MPANSFRIRFAQMEPSVHICRSRRLMKPRSTIGFAVALVTLLVLNASGLCAALVIQPAQQTHACCPTHGAPVRSTSVPHCCLATSTPVLAVAFSGPNVGDWPVFSNAGPAAIQLPQADTGIVPPTGLRSPCLYLHFHQLLI
jgi:hypothetical protein